MPDNQAPSLLPCPFCGLAPVFTRTFDQVPRKHYVRCIAVACDVMPETMRFLDQIAAARAWNTRK